MAVQIPFAGLLFMHRVLRFSTSCRRHLNRHIRAKLHRETRAFSVGGVNWDENEGDKSDPNIGLRPRPLPRRRRPLSPLERISGLLPQDVLSPVVMQLREQDQQGPTEDPGARCTPEETARVAAAEEDHSDASGALREEKPTLPGESLLAFGELLVAEYRKKGRVEFRKMFQLQSGERLQSSWGIILHDDIAGQPAGRFLKTGRGVPIFTRRASLEDYVLFMKRGPAIAYPKVQEWLVCSSVKELFAGSLCRHCVSFVSQDAATMLMMMDVTEGDCVLESGSGSGAMSLFLSRAVGSKGSVLSLEVREDHHRRAVQNYTRWRTSWLLRRGEEWPDNVHFHNADLCAASPLLGGYGFHAAALDLISPHLALPTVTPRLHHGAVCAVYLANITQVIDLLEGLRCLALPLLCERIIEVPIRDWRVAPALQKDGSYCIRKVPTLDEEHREEEADTDEAERTTQKPPAFGSFPYIARPSPEQMSHTAFLVKLRKCVL